MMNIQIHTSLANVEVLERVFAYLTPAGWVIPDWLILMRSIVEKKNG